jgi:peptidoglycan/xylan/chitin deacetylase (PgdA/CDA1 family)
MYHRVADIGSDPWRLAIKPAHFNEQLQVIRDHFCPIRLQDLIQAQRERNIPRRAVVVTFDDGYADNLYNAKPLLERYDIPATVFLTSGSIGSYREFWWDELDRLLLQPGRLPERLNLRINRSNYRWELGQAASYSEEEWLSRRRQQAWEGLPGSRHALYYSLWQLLYPLSTTEQLETLSQIVNWSGAGPAARLTHRALLPDEVCMLEKEGIIEIGAHSINHLSLPAHPIAVQRNEIRQSKAYLEEILGRRVTSFSYPYGDFTGDTITLIKEAGIACACSVQAASVRQQSDCFQLPRFEVQDWNGGEFADRLLRWFRR